MSANKSLSELQREYFFNKAGLAPGTPVGASATAAAAAANAVSLPAVAGKTNYLSGLVVSTGNPASAVTGVVTVTGLSVGTLSFQIVESVAAGGLLNINFAEPLPASAVDTAITVTLPAITSGAVSTVAVHGIVR